MTQNAGQLKPQQDQGFVLSDRAGVMLALAWLALVGALAWLLPPTTVPGAGFDSLRFILLLVAAVLPVAMIWVVVTSQRTARQLHDQTARLQIAIDALRRTYLEDRASRPTTKPEVEQRQDPPAETVAPAETPSPPQPRENTRIVIPRAAPQVPAQPRQRVDPSVRQDAEDRPLDKNDLIRALNFPDDENDVEGFAALRRALKDSALRKLIQASQDVLTLLSQDGIFMDELPVDEASADTWRLFAKGKRGEPLSELGQGHDQSSLDLAAARLRDDTIFRDAVDHFLRHFDQLLVAFAPAATDDDLLALAETRTTRAFSLMARVSGAFD